MMTTRNFFSLRALSWLLALAAIVLPVCIYVRENEAVTECMQQAHPLMCGVGLIVAIFFGAMIAMLLSSIAYALAYAAYRRLPRPRPPGRYAELWLTAAPVGLGIIAFVGALVFVAH